MDSEEWIKRRTSWWKWSEERWTSIWKVEHWRMRTSQSATTAVSWCQIRAACHERAAHGHDKRMLNHQEEVGSWRSRKKGHKMRPVKCHGSVMTLKVASELKSNVEIPPPTMRWITRSFSFPIPSDSVDYYSRCLWAIHCGWLMRCNSATVEWHSRIIKDVLFHFDNHLRGFFLSNYLCFAFNTNGKMAAAFPALADVKRRILVLLPSEIVDILFTIPQGFLKFELEFEVWIIIDIIIEANRYQDQDNRLVISVKWWISLTEDPWWKYQRKLDWSRDSDLTVGWCTMMYRWWLAIRLLECTLILLLLSDDRKQMNVALETGR